MRSSKRGSSGSLRVNIVGLPHLEQGGRNALDIFVLSAIKDRRLTRPACSKQSPKSLRAFRASQKRCRASQPHFGDCQLVSSPWFARDRAVSRGPLLGPLGLL